MEVIGKENPFRKAGLSRTPPNEVANTTKSQNISSVLQNSPTFLANRDISYESQNDGEIESHIAANQALKNLDMMKESQTTFQNFSQAMEEIDLPILASAVDHFQKTTTEKFKQSNELRLKSNAGAPESDFINMSDSLFVSPNRSLDSFPISKQYFPSNFEELVEHTSMVPIQQNNLHLKPFESGNDPYEKVKGIHPNRRGDTSTSQSFPQESSKQHRERAVEREKIPELSTQLNHQESLKKKKNLRNNLLQEIEQLRSDLALANSVNERMHSFETGSKTLPYVDAKVLSMLLRATGLEEKPSQKAKKKTIFQNLHAFLPFSSRRSKSSRLQAHTCVDDKMKMSSYFPNSIENSLSHLQAFTPLDWSSKITIIRKPPTSTSMNSDSEPELDLQREANKRENLRQQQIITASHRQGLFSARLQLIIDPISRGVCELSILSLPLCAENELGSFIRNSTKMNEYPTTATGLLHGAEKLSFISEKKNTSLEIGVVCYAMGRWLQVSLRRAKFWWLLVKHFSTSEARIRFFSLQKLSNSRKKNLHPNKSYNYNKKRKRVVQEEDPEEDKEPEAVVEVEASNTKYNSSDNYDKIEDTDIDLEGGASNSGHWIRKELLTYLGRCVLCISKNDDTTVNSTLNVTQKNTRKTDDNEEDSRYSVGGNIGIEILFEWNLSFDWTGEVKSQLSATPRVLRSDWVHLLLLTSTLGYETKDPSLRSGIDQIPQIFQSLLLDKGPFGAAADIIRLTMLSE